MATTGSLTIVQAAEILGVTEQTYQSMELQGLDLLTSTRYGRTYSQNSFSRRLVFHNVTICIERSRIGPKMRISANQCPALVLVRNAGFSFLR